MVAHFEEDQKLSYTLCIFLNKLQTNLSDNLLSKLSLEELIICAYENMLKRLDEISDRPTNKQELFLQYLENSLSTFEALVDSQTAKVISQHTIGPAPAA